MKAKICGMLEKFDSNPAGTTKVPRDEVIVKSRSNFRSPLGNLSVCMGPLISLTDDLAMGNIINNVDD